MTSLMKNDSRLPVLVTGAAGFIGSHVAAALIARGERVVGVDNLDPYYDVGLKHANLDAIPRSGFEFLCTDISDPGAMHALFARTRPGGVIHLAARAGVRPSIADPAGYCHANVTGTSVLLEEARKAGCSRFVLASSSSVYGNNAKVPFAEDDDVSTPISPYAATKRACELIAHAHAHLTKMPTACLRFFTVFGPRQRPDLAISLFLDRISRSEAIRVFGDGSSSRDYTYIDDIVRGVLASYDRVPDFGFRIWNLGGSRPTTLGDLIGTIASTVGREAIIDRAPSQAGDVERTFADLTRSTRELGFAPTTTLREGIALQWSAAKAARATARAHPQGAAR